MNPKIRTLFIFFIGALAGILAMYLFSNYRIEKKNHDQNISQARISEKKAEDNFNENQSYSETGIDDLTKEKIVVKYVKENHQLPDYYITKSEARNKGWNVSSGNLCEVLPGKAIGGDRFSNREKQLPENVQYYEADVNYNCGRRNADRIVFTRNGDVWLTKNHYKTFEKQ